MGKGLEEASWETGLWASSVLLQRAVSRERTEENGSWVLSDCCGNS